MPQNSNFPRPRGHRFFPKIGSYGYSAKSQWGPPRVHLGANGVPLGPKNGSKPLKITMPQNSNFRLPRAHWFFPKNGSYGCGAKSRCGSPRVHLWANVVPLGPKNGSNCRKLPCPKFRIFDDPAGIHFSQKLEVTVMALNHCGVNLGSILGPMGSHWVLKMVKTVKNYHAAKFEFSTAPRSSIFRKKLKLQLWRHIMVGTPRVHLGPNRVPLGPKNGSKPQKITMPQNSNFRLPRGHRFFPKNGSYGYSAKSLWRHPRGHLGVNAVVLG